MAFLKISNEELFFIEFGIEFHSILPLNINKFIPYDFVLIGGIINLVDPVSLLFVVVYIYRN